MSKSTLCTAGVFVKDGAFLLGLRNYTSEQYKDADFWTTPGGRCDEGEDVEATLRREVAEEIGVSEFTILEKLGVVPGAKEGDEVHVFACETSGEPRLMEPEKFKEWKWFRYNDIPENFLNHRVLELMRSYSARS